MNLLAAEIIDECVCGGGFKPWVHTPHLPHTVNSSSGHKTDQQQSTLHIETPHWCQLCYLSFLKHLLCKIQCTKSLCPPCLLLCYLLFLHLLSFNQRARCHYLAMPRLENPAGTMRTSRRGKGWTPRTVLAAAKHRGNSLRIAWKKKKNTIHMTSKFQDLPKLDMCMWKVCL